MNLFQGPSWHGVAPPPKIRFLSSEALRKRFMAVPSRPISQFHPTHTRSPPIPPKSWKSHRDLDSGPDGFAQLRPPKTQVLGLPPPARPGQNNKSFTKAFPVNHWKTHLYNGFRVDSTNVDLHLRRHLGGCAIYSENTVSLEWPCITSPGGRFD